MMAGTSKRERLEAAIRGEIADRPPVSLWRHFPVDDQSPLSLASSIARFQEEFEFDFVKVTPASSFCLVDWGVKDEWRGNAEGTREYTQRAIFEPGDWVKLDRLDPGQGGLRRQVECLRALREQLGKDTPIIQTVFSPLAQAKNLAGGERLLEHLHRDPKTVLEGLRIITNITADWVDRLTGEPLDGIFYAVQHASYRYFDIEGYALFGEPFDLAILERTSAFWLNVLHLHGTAIHFKLAAKYPVQVVNWHDREVEPDLAAGAGLFPGAVCGGVRRETLVLGTPDQVQAEAQESLVQVERRGVILGTGCVTPILAPRSNLQTLRQAVDFV
jgi:uroporphyrinogen decarboxylase